VATGNVTPCGRLNQAAPSGFFAAVHADHPVPPLSSCADVEEFNFSHADRPQPSSNTNWEPLIRFVAVVGIVGVPGLPDRVLGPRQRGRFLGPPPACESFYWPNGTAYDPDTACCNFGELSGFSGHLRRVRNARAHHERLRHPTTAGPGSGRTPTPVNLPCFRCCDP
jgi:hypothetical protein